MRKERDKCSKMGNGGMIATRWGERAEGGTSTGQSTSPKPLWHCSPPPRSHLASAPAAPLGTRRAQESPDWCGRTMIKAMGAQSS